MHACGEGVSVECDVTLCEERRKASRERGKIVIPGWPHSLRISDYDFIRS